MERTDQSDGKSLMGFSFEELEEERSRAVELADFQVLQAIEAEARQRDGLDDTDARFNYLANQCADDIKNAMTYYG